LPQFCVRTPGRSPGEPSTSCPGGWPATPVVGGNASAAEGGGRRGQPARISRLEFEGVGALAGALRWFGIGHKPLLGELGKPNKPVDVQSFQQGRATWRTRRDAHDMVETLKGGRGGGFQRLRRFSSPPPPLVGQPGVQHLRNWKRASALMVFNVSKAPYPSPRDPKPKFNGEALPLRGLIAFSTFSKLRPFSREGQVAPAVVGGANPQRAREGREGVGC